MMVIDTSLVCIQFFFFVHHMTGDTCDKGDMYTCTASVYWNWCLFKLTGVTWFQKLQEFRVTRTVVVVYRIQVGI
jgi:hypothetical protein